MRPSPRRLLRALLLLAAGPVFPAAADGNLALRAEGAYGSTDQSTTDDTGATTRQSSSTTTTKLGLGLREELLPLLRFYGDGTFERMLASGSVDGVETDTRQDRWRVYGRLTAGERALGGSLSFERSEEAQDGRFGGSTLPGLTLVRQAVGLSATWRPEGLPRLDLQASRSDQRDRERAVVDTTSDVAQGTVAYDYRRLHLFYRLGYSDVTQRLRGTETTQLGQGASLSWSDQFLGGRVGAEAAYQVNQSAQRSRVIGPGATLENRASPFQGLSGVEAFPALPSRITLSANPALIDGDTSTSAGINLGYGPSRAGDTDARDLGAQLSDTVTPVNTVYVYVDRPLTPVVSGALSWTAWRSDNNLDWAPVALTGPAQFDLVLNRFAIPVERTAARYLKVAARPLAAMVTTDPRFEAILVTELQLAEIVPLDSRREIRSSSLGGVLNAGLRVDLTRTPRLTYDFQGYLNHRNQPTGLATFAVTNGLSYEQPLSRTFRLDARLDRADGDSGRGHEATTRYSARLGAQPIPAAMATLSYAGQTQQGPAGEAQNNAFILFGRADPYRGVSLNANASYGFGTAAGGASTRSATAGLGSTLVPHRSLTLATTYAYQTQTTSQGGVDSTTVQERIDGTLSWAPFRMLYASAGIARVRNLGRWYTTASFNGNLSPLSGGELTLTFSYADTLDTSSDLRTRSAGPYLRWNFRTGAFVEAGWTWLDARAPVAHSESRAFNVRLIVPL